MVTSFDVVLSGLGLCTFGFMNENEAISALGFVTFGFIGNIETTWSNAEQSVTTTWGYY